MFVLYRLFHRCVHSVPSGLSRSTSPESSPPPDPEKDHVAAIWFTVFGLSLFFRPVAEFVIRILFFSVCVLLLSTLGGSLNLLVGHAVLKSVKYKGYDPPLLWSMEAGSLGGIIVLGPSTLVTVILVALLGGPKFQSALSSHVKLLLQLASVIAASTAACWHGVMLVRRMHPDDSQPLDATHAARAGALGACIVTVPIMATAALLMGHAQAPLPAQDEPVGPCLDDLVYPANRRVSSPRTGSRQFVTHAAAETVGYVFVALCILAIRLLCF